MTKPKFEIAEDLPPWECKNTQDQDCMKAWVKHQLSLLHLKGKHEDFDAAFAEFSELVAGYADGMIRLRQEEEEAARDAIFRKLSSSFFALQLTEHKIRDAIKTRDIATLWRIGKDYPELVDRIMAESKRKHGRPAGAIGKNTWIKEAASREVDRVIQIWKDSYDGKWKRKRDIAAKRRSGTAAEFTSSKLASCHGITRALTGPSEVASLLARIRRSELN